MSVLVYRYIWHTYPASSSDHPGIAPQSQLVLSDSWGQFLPKKDKENHFQWWRCLLFQGIRCWMNKKFSSFKCIITWNPENVWSGLFCKVCKCGIYWFYNVSSIFIYIYIYIVIGVIKELKLKCQFSYS